MISPSTSTGLHAVPAVHWKHHKYFDAEILALPRLNELWHLLLSCGKIFKIALPDRSLPKSPGAVFQAAEHMMDVASCLNYALHVAYGAYRSSAWTTQVLTGVSVVAYKVGFTHDPYERVQGYLKDGYHYMHLLHISASSLICKCIEAHLIRLYKGRQGCLNESLGGEGPDHFDGPYFVYVAVKVVR